VSSAELRTTAVKPAGQQLVALLGQYPVIGHTAGLLLVQMPFWQERSCAHTFPSLQLVPFGLMGLVHAPVDVLQVPASWH